MRQLIKDRDSNPFTRVDNELIRSGNGGDLDPRERFMLTYLLSHKEGYRIGTSQIVGATGWSRRTVQRSLKTLEEEGYLYRNRDNWDGKTGPQFIVANDPNMLRQTLRAENLFVPENHGPKSEEETEGEAEDERATGEPGVPKALLQVCTVVRRQWHEVEAKKQKPARFACPPVRQPTRPEEMLTGLWQLSIGHEYGVEVGASDVAYPLWPTLSGHRVCHMCMGGMPYVAQGVCHMWHTPYIEQLRRTTKRTTTASLLQSRRLSNVWRPRARALAESGPKEPAGGRPELPDRDRSHSRLFVEMLREKSGRPYHGIRLYSEMDADWDFRHKLHEHEGGSLSIYWLHPEREPGAPLPDPRPEPSGVTERPLDEGADPREAGGVPPRFSGVGILRGPDQPHPTGRNSSGRRIRASAGFKALHGEVEFSVKGGPHPWPDHLAYEEPTLSFAGHRPEEQLPEVKRASVFTRSTDFIKAAMRAIFEEPFEEDPRPTVPSAEDRRRAEEFSIPPRNVMVLRQIAEVTIDPHGPSFDYENTYESPGRDPWAIRMYSGLAFPGADLTATAKDFLDKKVAQACPTSPAEWASVLLMGLQREWDPKYVKNFARCYRHEMRIELDPGRDIKSRWTSKKRITRGTGIDLSGGDPEKIIPPDNRDDE